MTQDVVHYLNREPQLMAGGLVKALEELPAKLQKAPPVQWIATVKSLIGKGAAKQAEVDDCELITWLERAAQGDKRSIGRDEILDHVKNRQVTVKEVTLAEPRYASYSHLRLVETLPALNASYREVLFIANSERANLQDRLEEIEWELEQFNFDIERLSAEPEAVLQLEEERYRLKTDIPKAWDFSSHHFTAQAGKHGRNLIAHGRELVYGDTYLIEEVQSDWGQRGRKADWKGVPTGPFVTDTKLWSGLVVRRMLQRAALLPQVKKVAWIRGSMRNGGVIVGEDKLDEFYLKVVRGIVDKAISKAGGKSQLQNLTIGGNILADVPCFEMSEQVRAQLQSTQPLYSLAKVRPTVHAFSDARRTAFFERAKHMLGSVKHVRLVDRVYDLATGTQVPGRFFNNVVQVALNAAEPEFILDHECFHYGMTNLFYDHEREIILREFAPGSELNRRTHDTLLALGERAASQQCLHSAEEAAAHGFALWARDKLDMQRSPAKGFFQELRVLAGDLLAWFNRTVQKQECTCSEDVFKALLNGHRAEEEPTRARWREPA